MSAYYNEIDPYAALWLRNLINAGHIAAGEVDERDIRDVWPDDIRGFTQCHFFAGIGAWSFALRLAAWPDDRPVWTGSCPCQPFSGAGLAAGFADERHLWPSWHHLIRECGPSEIFGEQVASKDGLAWLDLVQTDLEAEDYTNAAIDLCAAGVGAPHIRQRLWFVAHANSLRLKRSGGRGTPQNERITERSLPGRLVGMAYSNNERLENGSGHAREPESSQSRGDDDDARSSVLSRLAHPERLERERSLSGFREKLGANGSGQTSEFAGRGAVNRLAYPDDDRREEGREIRPIRQEHDAEHGIATGGLDHSFSFGRHTGREGDHREHDGGVSSTASENDRPGPTNGIWRNADWLHCRDGKWRAVEPGTFPLANGAPARVGRLRAYGNAINPHVAKEVIAAYMECRP